MLKTTNDVYISIGSECSVAHYLRNKQLRDNAYPFDWNCNSLKIIYDLLSNDFSGFLDDVYIGNRTKRLLFKENTNDLKVSNDYIYPVICKKYGTLLPHDYDNITELALLKVKVKYNRRIERLYKILNSENSNDSKIYLVYNSVNNSLNEWQEGVYKSYKPELLSMLYTNNDEYIEKIKTLISTKFKNKNIELISLETLKKLI